MIQTTKRIGLLFVLVVLVLTGCRSKSSDEFEDWLAENEEIPMETYESPVEEVRAAYQSIQEPNMRIHTDYYNHFRYGSASHQQFEEIDAPYIESLLNQIRITDKEITDVVSDEQLQRKIVYDRAYDVRGWIQTKRNTYQRIYDELEVYKQPQPRTQEDIARKYQSVVETIQEYVSKRILEMDELLKMSNLKLGTEEGNYRLTDTRELIGRIGRGVVALGEINLNTELIFESIGREYAYYYEQEQKKFDSDTVPVVDMNY